MVDVAEMICCPHCGERLSIVKWNGRVSPLTERIRDAVLLMPPNAFIQPKDFRKMLVENETMKKVHNSLDYLVKAGLIERVSNGRYLKI